MRKVLTGLLIICSFVTFSSLTYAQAKAADTKAEAAKAAPKAMPAQAKMPVKPNFVIIGGTVTKIDSSNPDMQTIEVKSDSDNSVHTLNVTPYTNIVKATDISELKAGESVRVMTRKADDKEVAINVLFGKLKKMTPPRPTDARAPVKAPAAGAKK